MVALYSIGVNILLASLKAGLAVASGSLALAADAVHSLVDVVASVVVLAGLLIARRKSRAFPYGLYKVENLASVAVAFLIFLAGYEIAREALATPLRQVSNTPVALADAA
jgi:cation diffusion facilitator family transporter